MRSNYQIALLPGDGIGKEVIPEAARVIESVVATMASDVEFLPFDLGSDRYLRTGEVMPDSVLAEIATTDAILAGAVGSPDVPDGILGAGIGERFRLEFDLCVGYRPAQLLPGIRSPLADLRPEDFDLVVVRENSEGLYQSAGGRAYPGTDREIAIQNPFTTWFGVERVVRFAFELAAERRGGLVLSHKAPPLQHTGGLWLRALHELAPEFPTVSTDYEKIDSVCMHLISDPSRYDVIVSDVIFGDIVSDVAAAIQGGKRLSASSMINPRGGVPGVFEPLHGPAHDIAGDDTADPTGAILTAALLLHHLGAVEAADGIRAAVAEVRAATPAVASTRALTDAVIEAIPN